MMKNSFTLIALLLATFIWAQNEQLAQNYFNKGDFEKALISYEELLKGTPQNDYYFQRTIESAQQLQQFSKAEILILDRIKTNANLSLIVELGYNYQLKKENEKATLNYKRALEKINENLNQVYGVATTFEKKGLLDLALAAYEMGIKIDSKLNFNFQMAMLYGQKGNTDLMIEKLLTESYKNQQSLQNIQYQLSLYMNEIGSEKFNESLRKALLLKLQDKNLDAKDIFWNSFLSWFFVQKKEFGKAFIQLKAIYKRTPESFDNIINLAQLSVDENDIQMAQEIYSFILENSIDNDLKIKANYYLMNIRINAAIDKDFNAINSDLQLLIEQFGVSTNSLILQKLQARFVTFQLKDPEIGKDILKKALDLPLNEFQQADIKMELGNILLYQSKFNQALIYYLQIENDLKNTEISNEASLKIAKTSYFQTDFKWAQKQLKVLKAASTQLTANDALELFLLISDNTVADSTQVALKKFANADFLLYQNRNKEALSAFEEILKDKKTIEIEPITHYRIAKIFEAQKDYKEALNHYQKIIENYKKSIYVDEACYFAADIYSKLNDIDNAKKYYEEIIFKHQDSIYFNDARKKYRNLRGDKDL